MVSIVICAYTEARWSELLAAVESVRAQTFPVAEIIVVVDHNPDLLHKVRAHLSDVKAVENSGEVGLGGARNSGVSVAQGDVIAFLDDDALAMPNWIEELSSAYANPDVFGVGGSIQAVWEGGRPGWFPQEFDWVVGCTYQGMSQTAGSVRNLLGCNMSFRRQVFAEIGAFRLGYGCDETEFCIRLHQYWPAKMLTYNPRARVLHQVPSSRANWRYFISRCFFEGGSKAVVSWLVGTGDGLASERTYTFRTLPRGVIRSLADTLLGRDAAGLARAAAIIAGLAATTAGYLAGRLRVGKAAQKRGWQGSSAATRRERGVGGDGEESLATPTDSRACGAPAQTVTDAAIVATESSSRRSAVFLDRDGVIIEDRSDYVKTWEEVSFLPGAIEALRELSSSGHRVVVVTNQSAVGRGIISLEQAIEINRILIAEIERQGGRVEACYVCPHHPVDGCACRKPAPGMLLRAAEELGLDLAASYLIGDAVTDIKAASAVGVKGILVLTGRGGQQAELLDEHERTNGAVMTNLKAAIDFVIRDEQSAAA